MKTVSKHVVDRMMLRGKPRCPICGLALVYVYDGAKGYTGLKCSRCRQQCIVNNETLEVRTVTRA